MFQRLMDRILRGREEYAAAYLDDVIIHSETWEDHVQHVTSVLERLRTAGLTAKRSKRQFGKSECMYLGHRVGQGKVIPEQSKVEALKNFAVPSTKKEVRVFLGLAGYYQKFITDLSIIAAPLTYLMKRNHPNHIQWNDEDLDRAFRKIKDFLCQQPILRSPDLGRTFVTISEILECVYRAKNYILIHNT